MKRIAIIGTFILLMTGITAVHADMHGHNQKEHSHHEANEHTDNHGFHDSHGSKHHDLKDSKHADKHYSKKHHRGHHHGWKGKRFIAPVRYIHPRGYVVRTWHSGARLPTTYRTPQYYVDHRHYHLNAPPRDYRYIRVDNDVVLIAIASGVIVSVLNGLYY